MAKLIYIDVCALCRPFDDQSYLRIRLETEAVSLILSKVKEKDYQMLISSVHHKEIAAIEDEIERSQLQIIIGNLGKSIKVDIKKAKERANELVKLGFGIADAAHVAFAELSDAIFISCDDILIKKCLKHNIKVWCCTLLTFCEKEKLR